MVLCSSRKRSSPRNPRHLQPRRRDHLPHHLVDAAAERDDQVALGLAVQPVQQLGGRALGGVAVLADDLLGQPADPLNAFGAKYLRGCGVGDLDGLATRGDLPVEQLVDPPDRANLAEERCARRRGRSVSRRHRRAWTPTRAPGRRCAATLPAGPSITRSWFSCVVISRQPAFSSPTSMSAGTRTSL